MGRRGNPYFHFQQFSIWQDRCAMKVGVDGLLLGAWVSVKDTHQILDIGTGTGLIALMLAQKIAQAQITAIEIDQESYTQAKENIARSPWNQRIHLHHVAYQDFDSPPSFDLIVSNPPYFTERNATQPRAIARQQIKLSPQEIITRAKPQLKRTGRLALILPYSQASEIIEHAIAQGFLLSIRQDIRPTPTSDLKRSLLEFKLVPTRAKHKAELVIEVKRHQHSKEYIELLKDYLLKFK